MEIEPYLIHFVNFSNAHKIDRKLHRSSVRPRLFRRITGQSIVCHMLCDILFRVICTLMPSEKPIIFTLIPLGSGEKVGGGSRGVALSLIGTGTGRLCGMGGGGSFE